MGENKNRRLDVQVMNSPIMERIWGAYASTMTMPFSVIRDSFGDIKIVVRDDSPKDPPRTLLDEIMEADVYA